MNLITGVKIPTLKNEQTSRNIFFSICEKIHKGIIVGPEYLYYNYPLLNKQEKDRIIESYKNLTKKNAILIIPGTIVWTNGNFIYNTAYCIAKGKILLSYNKETTDVLEDELEKKENKEFYKLNETSVFSYENKIIGIEICRDHGHERLKRFLINKSKISEVDIQIIIANNLNSIKKSKLAIKNSGIALLVDGQNDSGTIAADKNMNLIKPLISDNEKNTYSVD